MKDKLLVINFSFQNEQGELLHDPARRRCVLSEAEAQPRGSLLRARTRLPLHSHHRRAGTRSFRRPNLGIHRQPHQPAHLVSML